MARVAAGDRVAPMFAPGWTAGEPTRERVRRTLGGPLDGTLADYLLIDAEGVSKVPDYLRDDEAATLPCAALTAWNALQLSGVKAGDVVLVQGTGGVSLFALQFAKILGARVIATSSSFDKLRRVTEMGAWETINYAVEPNWGAVAKEMTGGAGVDQVIDIAGSTLEQSLRAVKIGGTISTIGMLGAGEVKLRPPRFSCSRCVSRESWSARATASKPCAAPSRSTTCTRWSTASFPSKKQKRPSSTWRTPSISARSALKSELANLPKASGSEWHEALRRSRPNVRHRRGRLPPESGRRWRLSACAGHGNRSW